MLRSRFVTVIVVVLCASATRVAADDRFDPTSDLTVTSRTIHLSGKLDPTPDHPYLGFWKHSCSEDFGLAIAAAGPNLYSVSFCGKAGCFRPGTYVPNTTLVGDRNYKVESPTRIAVKGMGKQFDVYLRCWPPQ
jgi:hypothetical protein